MCMLGLFKHINKKLGNTIYYPGCVTHFKLPGLEDNYTKILKKLEIDFLSMDKSKQFICCGGPVMQAGYREEFESLQERFLKQFDEKGATKIITNCPLCFHIIKTNYPELEVTHTLQIIEKKLKKMKLRDDGRAVTYLDSSFLGRYQGIYEEPRNILTMLGFRLVELDKIKDNSYSDGSEGLLPENSPKIANEIAKELFKKLQTNILVTSDIYSFVHLKQNAPAGVEVYEISQLILKSLE